MLQPQTCWFCTRKFLLRCRSGDKKGAMPRSCPPLPTYHLLITVRSASVFGRVNLSIEKVNLSVIGLKMLYLSIEVISSVEAWAQRSAMTVPGTWIGDSISLHAFLHDPSSEMYSSGSGPAHEAHVQLRHALVTNRRHLPSRIIYLSSSEMYSSGSVDACYVRQPTDVGMYQPIE